MKSTIRLFKAVPINTKRKKKASKELLEKTIKKGFIFSPEVIHNYTEKKLLALIKTIEEEYGLTAEQLNNSFHKSWKKVRDASMEQLVMEQIIHYITTYGFEAMGFYDKDLVYISNEKLELPKLEKGISLVVIKGYTKEELKKKLISMLGSGIALGEETIKDVVDVCNFVKLKKKEIENIKNKEVKITLYEYLKIIPENPIEFLRYAVYSATDNTLLIKDKATIEMIKEKGNVDVLALFVKYKKEYGLNNLAQIFLRFKPLFLAFKTHKQLNHIINRIRKLAKKHHKPMKEDYLNNLTANIKKGNVDDKKLKEELDRVNTFRKIRLAYALKYRTKDADSILYKIRNGKAYATDFYFTKRNEAKRILSIVMDSITKDLKKNVNGKKVYIPEYITYALPATEKQFTGDFPSGTYVTVDKDLIAGVYWENVDSHRIDLDLSLISAETGKIGWDSSYRTDDRSVLFSGDVTDSSGVNGASELFYVRRKKEGAFIMMVNYYNYDEDVEVPFKIIVGKEQVSNLKQNYMINPDNVVSIAKTNINKKMKMLGLLVTTTQECRFYFSEAYLGCSITSSDKEFVKQTREYLVEFYKNSISLNDVLEKAGAKLIKDKDKCDIDLSPETLEKDTILGLIH